MGLGLKSDGHGNGGTSINGNGGTYYHLSKFRQPFRLFASIYIFKYILETVEHFFTGLNGFI